MGITHAFTNPKSDGADTTVVRPSDWNAEHVGGNSVLTTTGDMAYGDAPLGTDKAYSTTATSNKGNYAGAPSNCIDENDSTVWVANDTYSAGCYLHVDIVTAAAITRFRVLQGNGAAEDNRACVVESSANNSDWTTHNTVLKATDDSGIVVLTDQPGARRYWRLRDTGGGGRLWAIKTFSLWAVNFTEQRLPIGTDNYVLRVATDLPAWEAEFDATVPSTQAFGDSAAAGSAVTAARRDHKHAMPGGLAHSYVGYNTAGGSWEAMPIKFYLKKFTLSAAAVILAVEGYFKQTDNSFNGGVLAGLWTDDAGDPYELRAANTANQSYVLRHGGGTMNARWITVPLGIYLPSGDYWAGFLSTGGSLNIAYDTGGSDHTVNTNTSPVWPDGDYYATPTDTTYKYSIRASVLSW